MSSPKALRIGIVGGGIAGTGLAGVLSNSLPRASITLMERSSASRDQGYGIDLNPIGQDVLKRAGVWDRFWEISRPRSDVSKYFTPKKELVLVQFVPSVLRRILRSRFPAQPETNRTELRRVLLEAMHARNNVQVLHRVHVDRASFEGKEVLLSDPFGKELGRFDLVVDASGVHSSLRHLRMDDPEGAHYAGRVLIHGVISDPSEICSGELSDMLGEGTAYCYAKGYVLCLQRFEASPNDKRTAFFYMVFKEKERHIWEEMGVSAAESREAGTLTDERRLRKVKDWLHRDMGHWFSDVYHGAVEGLDRVTVRPQYDHGKDTRLRSDSLTPIVSIGDAQRNIGLGGGGEFALQDVTDLAEFLCQEGAADSFVCIDGLRSLEENMLRKKKEFYEERNEIYDYLKQRPDNGGDPSLNLREFLEWRRSKWAAIVPLLGKLSVLIYEAENWFGNS